VKALPGTLLMPASQAVDEFCLSRLLIHAKIWSQQSELFIDVLGHQLQGQTIVIDWYTFTSCGL
jgi:hypothetical protein